jgi:hypothetical protein
MFTAGQAKGLSMVFLQSLGSEVPPMRRLLASVPEAQPAACELMWHIAHSDAWFGDSIVAGSFGEGGSDGLAPVAAAEILAYCDLHVPSPPEKIAPGIYGGSADEPFQMPATA